MTRRVLFLAACLALVPPALPALHLDTSAFAQQVLADTPIGWAAHEGNEGEFGAKNADPAKVRITTPINEDGGGGGVVSFNANRYFGRINFGGDQLEMAMIRVEQASDVRGQLGNLKGEFNFLLNDGSGQDDAAMRKPLAFTWNQVTRFEPALAASFAAHLAPYLGSGGGGSRMVSPDGRYWLQLQTDGNYVIYDSQNPNPQEPIKAYFDLWSLMARLDRIDAELRALESKR